MKLMRLVPGLLEGLVLAAVGLYMLALADSDAYWLLFNPKYRWVTATGGTGITLAGAALFFFPAQRPGATRLAAWVLLVGMLAGYAPQQTAAPAGSLTGTTYGSLTGNIPDRDPRETYDGREYVRLNVAELFFVANEQRTDHATDYVTRGMVRRAPDLDAAGQIGLMRVAVTCCLADAVGLGVRVAVDDPSRFADGSWLKVWGRLRAEPLPAKNKNIFRRWPTGPGVLTALDREQVLVPDHLEREERPGLEYVFDIRRSEPYAYD